MNLGTTLILALAMICAGSLAAGAVLLLGGERLQRRRRLERRLERLNGPMVKVNVDRPGRPPVRPRSELLKKFGTRLRPMLLRRLHLEALELRFARAAPGMSLANQICLGVAMLLLGGIAAALLPLIDRNLDFRNWWAGSLIALVPVVLRVLIALARERSRQSHLEKQLADGMDMIAQALRAGRVFTDALSVAAREGPSPLADELQITVERLALGMPLEMALRQLSERVRARELRFFVMAVQIQSSTGGNLADLIDSVSALTRERQRQSDSIRVQSAEGRLSAWILCLLPFLLVGALVILNPRFISALWVDPVGQRLGLAALLMMAGGVWWTARLVQARG